MNILDTVIVDGKIVHKGQNVIIEGNEYVVDDLVEKNRTSWVYLYSPKYDDYSWISLGKFRQDAEL